MSNSFQNEIPSARVNIKLDLHTGGAQQKIEIPLKLLAIGDYSNGKEEQPVAERRKIEIHKNNFNQVLEEFSPEIEMRVENTLAKEQSERNIKIVIKEMKDFQPEFIARQIPELRALLSMRNLLKDLSSNLLDDITFRKEVEKIIQDETLAEKLRNELETRVPQVLGI